MAFTKGTANFTNGSKVVTGVSLTSGQLAYFASGTAVFVQSEGQLIEATGLPKDGNGDVIPNQFLLRGSWTGATGSYEFVAFDTIEGLRDAVQSARGFSQQLQDTLTGFDVEPTPDSFAKRTPTGAIKAAPGENANESLVVSQASAAASSDKLVKRLSDGRAKFAAATEADDALVLGQVDVNATANKIVKRTEAGQVKTANAQSSDEAIALGQLPDDIAHLFARNNIVGSVSESGGIPTGALMEHDSNSDGEYWKYADGKLINITIVPKESFLWSGSHLTASTQGLTIFRSANPNIYMPCVPIGPHVIEVNLIGGLGSLSPYPAWHKTREYNLSDNAVQVQLLGLRGWQEGNDDYQDLTEIHLTLIGSWY